jgi:hypothetical protein
MTRMTQRRHSTAWIFVTVVHQSSTSPCINFDGRTGCCSEALNTLMGLRGCRVLFEEIGEVTGTVMNDVADKWKRRWWLRIDQVGAWSKEEVKASGAIWLTFAFMAMFNAVVAYVCLYGMEFGREARFLGAFLFATIACAYFRGAAGELVPYTTMLGDKRAAERLGLDMPLWSPPPPSNRLWWLDWRSVSGASREERYIAIVIWFVMGIIFIPSSWFGIAYLQRDFDFSKRTSILVVMTTLLPLSFYLGRRLCVWLWPDFVRTADYNAAHRYRKLPKNRSKLGGEGR